MVVTEALNLPGQRVRVVMSAREQRVFLYDFNSRYAYLAAARVDEVLPITPRWQPVALAFMLRAHNRRPWSFDERERRVGVAECERRARAYGLPAAVRSPRATGA